MCTIRSALRLFVLAVALLLTHAAVAEAHPPRVGIYSGPVYTPGYHVTPGVYVYPQARSTPPYVYPSYYNPVYPYSATYPYSLAPYGSYYNSWITPSLYPTYPYSGGYYGYSYFYRW